MINYTVIKTRHNGTEAKTFTLTRPDGTDDFLFIHFKTPVAFRLGKEPYTYAGSGSCIILTPGTPHAFYPCEGELIHDWFHFMPDNTNVFLSSGLIFNTFFSPADCSFITSSVKRCEQELVYREKDYEAVISCELNLLFIRLSRMLEEKQSFLHSQALRKLRVEIYRTPGKYSGAEQMADELKLSRTRFSVIYKDYFGISPNRDLIAARISMAVHLLTVGSLKLEQIAELCGYQSIYHFSRQFRKETGITPGEYRKKG